MKPATLRLALAAVLFFGWIGWLAYLAFTTTRPIILSGPQFLVSTLDVIADVKEASGKPDPQVIVRQVHWPRTGAEGLVGQRITVTNLAASQGWTGPGEYILPLVKNGKDYQVPRVPLSPGFSPDPDKNPPRIYPYTAQTLRELEEMPKDEPSPAPRP